MSVLSLQEVHQNGDATRRYTYCTYIRAYAGESSFVQYIWMFAAAAVQQGRIQTYQSAYPTYNPLFAITCNAMALAHLQSVSQNGGLAAGIAPPLPLPMPPSRLQSVLQYATQLVAAQNGGDAGSADPLSVAAPSADGVCEVAARTLFALVEWARRTPFFGELPLTDQVALLRANWPSLFLLTSAQSGLPLHVGALVAAAGLSLNEELLPPDAPPPAAAPPLPSTSTSISATPADTKAPSISPTTDSNAPNAPRSTEKYSVVMDHIRLYQEHVEKLRALELDTSEYSCLKALVLFSPGTLFHSIVLNL